MVGLGGGVFNLSQNINLVHWTSEDQIVQYIPTFPEWNHLKECEANVI